MLASPRGFQRADAEEKLLLPFGCVFLQLPVSAFVWVSVGYRIRKWNAQSNFSMLTFPFAVAVFPNLSTDGRRNTEMRFEI